MSKVKKLGESNTHLSHAVVSHAARMQKSQPVPEVTKRWQCLWDNHGRDAPCTKGFQRKSDLLRHHNIHTGTRRHACKFPSCGKTFIQLSALNVHTRTHTGEKPHCCPQENCDSRFSDSSSLARHKKIHSNERPYKCDIDSCDKSFCRKATLTRHIERDHPYSSRSATEDHSETQEDYRSLSPESHASSHLRAGSHPIGEWMPMKSESMYGHGLQHPKPLRQSPFSAIPSPATPDSSYRNYPHPNLSHNQVQSLTSSNVRGLVTSAPSEASQGHGQTSRIQTGWLNMNNVYYDSPMAASLQASPGSLSAGSTAPESIASMEYCHTPTSAATEYSQHPYPPTMNQLQFNRMQAQQRHYTESPREMTPLSHMETPVQGHSFHVEPMMQHSPVSQQYEYHSQSIVPDFMMQQQQQQQMQAQPQFEPTSQPMAYNHIQYQEPVDAGCVPTLRMPQFPLRSNFDSYFEDKEDGFDQQPMPGQIF